MANQSRALEGTDLDYAVAVALFGEPEEEVAEGVFRFRRDESDGDELYWFITMKQPHQQYMPTGRAEPNFSPSTIWAHGGPIIERERINIHYFTNSPDCSAWTWKAEMKARGSFLPNETGETALVAAMRAFITAKAKT